jgi:hypothetical protein
VNPFAVLGLPEWPDLDDQTVTAAWQQIATDTSPARPDGGDLAKYAQASAAYMQLDTPQGRAEAYAALAAATSGYVEDDPGDDLADSFCDGGWPGDELVPVILVPVMYVPEPVPLREVARMIAEIPARIRRGHPGRTLIVGVLLAGLALAVLTVFPALSRLGVAAAAAALFVMSGREDMAPRPGAGNYRGRATNQPTDRELMPPAGPRAPGWSRARTQVSRRKRLGSGGLSIPLPPTLAIVACRAAALKVVLPAGSSTLTASAQHAGGQGRPTVTGWTGTPPPRANARHPRESRRNTMRALKQGGHRMPETGKRPGNTPRLTAATDRGLRGK